MMLKFLPAVVSIVFLYKTQVMAQRTTIPLSGRGVVENMIAHDGKAYFIRSVDYVNQFHVYDGNTVVSVSMPYIREPRSAVMAAAGNKVFIAGDYLWDATTNTESPSNKVHIYNTANGTWTTDRLSEPRIRMAATSTNGKVIFAGGNPSSQGPGFSATVDIYDVITGTWSTAALSQARYYLDAVTVGDLAFFIGGSTSSGRSPVMDVYNASNNTWTTKTLPEPVDYVRAAVVGNLIFISGSRNFDMHHKLDVYNVTNDTWSVLYLPFARANASCIAAGDKVFFAGGQYWQNGRYLDYQWVDTYDVTSQTFWGGGGLSERIYDPNVCVAVGNKVVFPEATADFRSQSLEIHQTSYGSVSTPSIIGPASINPYQTFDLSIPSSYAGSVIRWEYSPDQNNWYISENPTTAQGFPGIDHTHYIRVRLNGGPNGFYYSHIYTANITAPVISGPSLVSAGKPFVLSIPSYYAGHVARWEYSPDQSYWYNSENPTTMQGFPGLDHTHYFRVKLNGGPTGSYYSQIHTVNVPPTFSAVEGGEKSADDNNRSISVSPNPASRQSVRLTLFEKEAPGNLEKVHVEITSMMGEVKYARSFSCQEGCKELLLDVQDLSTNLYNVKIRLGSQVYSRRLVIK